MKGIDIKLNTRYIGVYDEFPSNVKEGCYCFIHNSFYTGMGIAKKDNPKTYKDWLMLDPIPEDYCI